MTVASDSGSSRLAAGGWIAIKVILVLGLLFASGYGIEKLADRLVNGPSRVLRAAAPTPPPGADDPWNPAILVEGGTFDSRSYEEGADTHFSPYYTGGEGFGRQAVPGFWMQAHEVTNQEYRRFDPGHDVPEGKDRHPVVGITWERAMAYADFVGGTLPTELQWEYAARGTAGHKYPWGDTEPTCEKAHYRACDPDGTVEVVSRPAGATAEGIHDLAGNVWEWVKPNWFEAGRTPVNRASRRLRGGSFRSEPFFLRAVNRNNDFYRGYVGQDVGFRVVWPLEDGED